METATNPVVEATDLKASSQTQTDVPTGSVVEQSRDAADAREGKRSGSPLAMGIMATFVALYSIYFARAILMPIVLAITLALLFRPLVRRCRRYRIPDPVSAGFTLMLLVSFIGLGAANLIGPANDWIKNAPVYLREAGAKLHVIREQIAQFNEATEKVQELAKGASEEPIDPYPFAAEPDAVDESRANGSVTAKPVTHNPVAPAVDAPNSSSESPPLAAGTSTAPARSNLNQPMPVEVMQPRLTTGIAVASVTGGLLAEIVVTLVLAYFLLSSGDMLINNVLRILPTFRDKRNTVELVHSIERGISSYLLLVTCINLALGCMIGLAMWWLGMPTPILWGAMGTLFNFIPFLGALAGTFVVFVVAILSFDSLAYAALVPIAYFGLTALEGNFITPHLLGRSMSLNPIMVFLSLTFWGWMWGVGGALLAVPILATLKVGFDQFERTRPMGTLLGGDPLT